jgi:hypothetical protein
MALMIEYYSSDKKLRAVRAPSRSVPHAIEMAKEGLTRHSARYAKIVDIGRGGKLVGMIHSDVRP